MAARAATAAAPLSEATSFAPLLNTVRPQCLESLKQLASPVSSADDRMYALVQLEHMVSERVLHGLPRIQRNVREQGMRRQMFFHELERCCDWSTYVNGVRIYCVYLCYTTNHSG